MDGFSRQPDETILRKGSLLHVDGDPGVKSILTGRTTVTSCAGILTTKRFVACKKVPFLHWGGLPWLVFLLRKRKIVFEIPLSAFVAIERVANAKNVLLFKGAGTSEHRTIWTGLLARPDRWVQAIADAVVTASPGTKAVASDGRVNFSRSA